MDTDNAIRTTTTIPAKKIPLVTANSPTLKSKSPAGAPIAPAVLANITPWPTKYFWSRPDAADI